jgi:hypothetical protein
MKKLLLLGVLFFSSFESFSQISVAYYQSSSAKTAVAYNFSDRLWTEVRVYGNAFTNNFTPEAALLYNIIQKENHSVYIGAGVNLNGYQGFIVPMGVQIRPLSDFRNLSLHIEFQPMYDFNTYYILQSSFGFRYHFKTVKQKI